MALFLRQVWTLVVKNLLLAFVRRPFSTPFRAFLLPCVFIAFISWARFFFIPPSVYGIGDPSPVRSLPEAIGLVAPSRQKLVFVNSGYNGGDIDAVVNEVVAPIRQSGIQIQTLQQEDELLTECRNNIQGISGCIAAAVFYSSPSEGDNGIWNYSIRADSALASKIVTTSDRNDAQVYVLPFQHAIDFAIANRNGTSANLSATVENYPYTSTTPEQRQRNIRRRYMGGIIDILAVAFYLGMVGVSYQLTGVVAMEREIGMAQLLDCMMPNKSRWQPQAARILANHLSLDLIYLPGWIVMAIILSVGVFSDTSPAVIIIFNLLAGLSTSSFAIFGAGFFRKAQLSGITTVIIFILLAIVAQIVGKAGTGSVAVLSLLFPPMNYVYFIILVARWERQDLATNLIRKAPENPSSLPGIVLWVFMIIQIIVYPILGALIERLLYGTSSPKRKTQISDSNTAINITNFTKVYQPRWMRRLMAAFTRQPPKTVLAVNDLNMQALRGEIMVYLGANGSGKSTTLDAIAGLTEITSGEITINFAGQRSSLGLCPQRNVLWDDLTVLEHIRIFNKIKSIGKPSSRAEHESLLTSCDIPTKASSKSKTLSGGQKRKLQLAMMFTGGSSVCCVDEVSSGLDPISRRKIWDILLAERGKRSILLTTHFLDEADLLADHITIISRGMLKAYGTSVELKHRLGSGYRVHVYHGQGSVNLNSYQDIPQIKHEDQTIYMLPSSTEASSFVSKLEQSDIREYQISGPTIEDVFLKLADEMETNSGPNAESRAVDDESTRSRSPNGKKGNAIGAGLTDIDPKPNSIPELLSGKRIGLARQAMVLFWKRLIVVRRNALPSLAALLIPIAAAGLVTLFLKGYELPKCTPQSEVAVLDIESLSSQINYRLVAGPRSALTPEVLTRFASTLPGRSSGGGIAANTTQLLSSLTLVDTLDEFNNQISTRFANITPGGFFAGDVPTFAWRGNGDISFSHITQNLLDNVLTETPIASRYQPFDVTWPDDVGKPLQLITYFGLVMSVYPAFFALYPTLERLRNVRGLHYSNGVRAFPLWLAYTAFDFVIVLVVSAVAIAIFAGASSVWYHIGYLFVVFFLYGLASALLSYTISLFSRSQLAAFAFAAAGQAVMFLLYFIAYMSIITYVPNTISRWAINTAHFTIAIISPMANLTRSLFLSLNVFSITCEGREYQSYPGAMTAYGGPILYLIVQSLFLFGLLLWWDSGSLYQRLRAKKTSLALEDTDTADAEVSNELTRVSSTRDGLRVLRVTKQFKSNIAVNDVTFGVPKGEVFALLGPNGAGKSTCISLIRGDLQPSRRGGDILVEDVSVIKHRALARSRLGVCPQFDAMDTMTVAEHLHFYARVRGVSDPRYNVQAVMKAVGMEEYADRMAAKLSGGNKRKLSLGIALMGNPAVLLLDEPSSGMDAASKRVMWRTLASVTPGRSLVLTTHSMEEADALAKRAGIMASKMLALGTTDYLRRKHGDSYYVHLVHSAAPHTSDEDMNRIRVWVREQFPQADVEEKTYHGQLRFSVPTSQRHLSEISTSEKVTSDIQASRTSQGELGNTATTIPALFTELESRKHDLGIEHYSVSRATLDQVFLNIVGKHNVAEEGTTVDEKQGSERPGVAKKEKGKATGVSSIFCCL